MAKVMKPAENTGVTKKETAAAAPVGNRPIELPRSISVRDLAELTKTSAIDIIKQLMRIGVMANINQVIDYDAAATVATALGFEPHMKARAGAQVKKRVQAEPGETNLPVRPPVVTIMGHVDHGKTKLLDAIRQTNVVATEAGGITQHIGAYQVTLDGNKITFLDTPGHEAFTAMRAHGAQITDVAVLVVAADDGVMPQTLEAIDHARAAGVPIIVAINKVDKPTANVDKVKQQLTDAGLLLEEWGGDTIAVPVSAKEKKGISELLENILLVSEMQELKADPARMAVGVVIEARMDKSRGSVATVLIQDGTLRIGDTVVVGEMWGHVRAMFNDLGKQIRKAEPAMPVEILGLNGVPLAGDILTAVLNEHQAQTLVLKHKAAAVSAAGAKVRLDNIYNQITAGGVKELNIILKTDVQGSIEPIKASLERLGQEQVQVRIIRAGTGNITESDVLLAIASKGLIIGFNANVEPGAKRLAELEGVDIRRYDIIYNIIDDVQKALTGLLEPTYVEVIVGRAEVRAVFTVGKSGKVAGVFVTEGRAARDVPVRVKRGNQVLADTRISSLKRFKDDVKEVASGYEAGIGLEKFSDIKVGDILEFYSKEKA